jgi:hypothetical protein
MKIWTNQGSEHSANLVMIGRFKTVESAVAAKAKIDEITEFICNRAGDDLESSDRYPPDVIELFRRLNMFTIAPQELQQFRYDVSVTSKENEIRLSTDEYDISAFLKLLVDGGAKVEVYSAHDYPDKPKKSADLLSA